MVVPINVVHSDFTINYQPYVDIIRSATDVFPSSDDSKRSFTFSRDGDGIGIGVAQGTWIYAQNHYITNAESQEAQQYSQRNPISGLYQFIGYGKLHTPKLVNGIYVGEDITTVAAWTRGYYSNFIIYFWMIPKTFSKAILSPATYDTIGSNMSVKKNNTFTTIGGEKPMQVIYGNTMKSLKEIRVKNANTWRLIARQI